MKNSITKLIAILFITTIFSSCAVDMFNKVTGNRNVISQDRKATDNFTGVKISTGLDLYISQGSKNTITVEADENLHDIIITEVENGILKIYSEKGIWKAKSRKIYVTVKTLTSLKATSGSDIYGQDIIKTAEISISATSGADIRVSIDAQSIETSATSGAGIRISGIAVNHASSATSGSSIDAYELKSRNAIAKATSGADINIYASERLEAKATSGGDIDFMGNPKEINKKSNSGGSVSAK
ncbi:DUF2807 domain-containing protein [Polaribacter sp. SA4-10]|uniref:head GIN domain-containing protein n=1 Tax=Polaribacter sp. SA4-10 TaxID=754397 RepID=UPI000B57EA62|nr:head GIN domain-containing protein [Polaribacter sp. SA4-10]ARV07830.1 DUF2807 domain-containing protein [Polaribacter sp. SA4-10]